MVRIVKRICVSVVVKILLRHIFGRDRLLLGIHPVNALVSDRGCIVFAHSDRKLLLVLLRLRSLCFRFSRLYGSFLFFLGCPGCRLLYRICVPAC